MRFRFPLLALLLLLVAPAVSEAQKACVEIAKARHPGLAGNRAETLIANREVAWCSGKGAHGVFVKTSGNNCEGYSCDVICTKARNGWDIWVDWEGDATPAWQSIGNLDPSRCELVTSDPGGVDPPIPPNPPPTTSDDLKAIRADVAVIRKLLEDWPR